MPLGAVRVNKYPLQRQNGGVEPKFRQLDKYFYLTGNPEPKGARPVVRFQSQRSRTFSRRKPYILFLCTGNTCRSPMSYGIMKKLLAEEGLTQIDVRTAGVMTIPGLLPTQECRQILTKDNVDIGMHRSCKMTPEILRRATLILGMTSFHVQMALRLTDDAKDKTFLLKEYVGISSKNSQIQDPMGCTLEVYKRVYREVKKACKRLVQMDILRSDEFYGGVEPEPSPRPPRPQPSELVVTKPAAPAEPAPKPAAKKSAKKKSTSAKPAKKTAAKKKNTAAEPAKKKTAVKKTEKKTATKKNAAKGTKKK